MLQRLLFALGVSLCAALAVHLSYGPAFVDDVVGYSSTAYICALTCGLARFSPSVGLVARWPLRAAVGLMVGSVVLMQLRGWALWTLPFGAYLTTGHTPFVVFPVAAGLSLLLLELLARLFSTKPSAVETSASGASGG